MSRESTRNSVEEYTMSLNANARRDGLALLKELHGENAAEAMAAEQAELCPEFVDMTVEWALGSIMTCPGLDLLTRELLLIASYVTLGNAVPQLRAHVQSAQRLGATRQQVIETIVQMLFYAGGPAVRNSLVAVQDGLAAA